MDEGDDDDDDDISGESHIIFKRRRSIGPLIRLGQGSQSNLWGRKMYFLHHIG